MARKTLHYIKCDFCTRKSHPYTSKDVLDSRVFGEGAIYPWKVTSKGKHACNSCFPKLKDEDK